METNVSQTNATTAKEIVVSDDLLSLMVSDNYEKWLQHITEGRISKKLVSSLAKLTSFEALKCIRETGIEQFNLGDEQLDEAITKEISRTDNSPSLYITLLGYNSLNKRNKLRSSLQEHAPNSYEP